MLLVADKAIYYLIEKTLRKKVFNSLIFSFFVIVVSYVIGGELIDFSFWVVFCVFFIGILLSLKLGLESLLNTVIFSIEIFENRIKVSFYQKKIFGLKFSKNLDVDIQHLKDYQEGEVSNYGLGSCVIFSFYEFQRTFLGLKSKEKKLIVVKEFFNTMDLEELKTKFPLARI